MKNKFKEKGIKLIIFLIGFIAYMFFGGTMNVNAYVNVNTTNYINGDEFQIIADDNGISLYRNGVLGISDSRPARNFITTWDSGNGNYFLWVLHDGGFYDLQYSYSNNDFYLINRSGYLLDLYNINNNDFCIDEDNGSSSLFTFTTFNLSNAGTCQDNGYSIISPIGFFATSDENNGITDININSTGSITMLSNGVELTGVDINKDFYINYVITKYDENNIGVDVDSGTKGPFTSGINNIQFLNHDDFSFQSLGLYDLDITFINVNDETDITRKIYNADYIYNEGYVDPGTINFSFFVSGFTFFENGFALNNFVPDPSGGKLYFDIIAPNPSGTGTIDLQTSYFLPYEIDGNGYGIDSSVIVTYPYHQVAGIYQVRVVYDYDGVIVYPFGTDYNSYEITLAELPANYSPDEIYICDKNGDGINDIGESIACPITILKYYTEKITDNLTKLKDFFRTIMNIGTNEVKTFSFIGSANANFLDNMPAIETQDNVFSKLYYFIKGFLYLVFLLLAIVLIIYLKKE